MIATHHWVATLPDGRDIRVESGSNRASEIRGDVAIQFRVPEDQVKVTKLT